MVRIASSLAQSWPRAFEAGPFPLKRLLALTDLSAAGDNAAWRAGLLAAEHGASVHLVHLRPWHQRADASQRRLEATAWHLQERLNIPVLAQSVPRTHGRDLQAAAAQADLVVVPSPDGVAGQWISSLSPQRVLRHLKRPTLAVRRPAAVPYQRVLACIHEAGHAASCIATATGMAGGPHVDLHRYAVADESRMAGLRLRDELEADSLARYVQGRIHALAQELGAGRMKEVPAVAFTASADVLLDEEYALLPELVVTSHLPSLARGLLAGTMADTLLLAPAGNEAAAAGQPGVPSTLACAGREAS
jgi:hypothetical protein